MAIDWLRVRADPIEAVEHGVRENADLFESVWVGPTNYNRIDYPAAEVLPQSTNREGGNQFSHTVFCNLYFERGRELDYVDDVLHTVAGVVTDVLQTCAETDTIGTYVPAEIQDFSGELDGTSLFLLSIRFEIGTSHDLADTAR